MALRLDRIKLRAELHAEIARARRLRPRVREDCMPVRRYLVRHLPIDDPYRVHAPCPFVSCRHHLHLDVGDGGITMHDRPIEHTCALDVADQGEHTCEAIAEMLPPMSAEGIRLAEVRALKLLRQSLDAEVAKLREYAIADADDDGMDARRSVRVEDW